MTNQVIPAEAVEGEGLAYFSGIIDMTSTLDGTEMMRGFLDGIKEGIEK